MISAQCPVKNFQKIWWRIVTQRLNHQFALKFHQHVSILPVVYFYRLEIIHMHKRTTILFSIFICRLVLGYTRRACVRSTESADITCKTTKSHDKDAFCGQCLADKCNGASAQYGSAAAVLIVIPIAIMKIFSLWIETLGDFYQKSLFRHWYWISNGNQN